MPSRFWNCTRPADTFPYRTKKYPRHEVCILFYRNVEVLFVLMCFLLALVNGYVLSANRPEFLLTDGKCILQVPFAAKTSTLYEIRNNKGIILRYTTVLQQIQISYMFRPHKAAIIRPYVLENVKN
jgi:hypothetical protein